MSQQPIKYPKQSIKPFEKGIVLILLGIMIVLAVSVVAMKEKVRIAQTKLFEINSELQVYRESWGELMLQKTHLESPAKVELVAKQTLQMQPKPSKILTLKLLPPVVDSLETTKSHQSSSSSGVPDHD